MAHALLKEFKSNLAGIVAQALGRLESYAIVYATRKINEIIDELRDKCPPPPVLNRLSKLVGNIKKVVVKIDARLDTFRKIPEKLDKPIKAGTILVDLISKIPVPTAIGTPPGPAGGLILAVKTGKINTLSNLLVWGRKMVETLGDDQKAVINLLKESESIFEPIKERLDTIDKLLQRCAENPDLSKEDRDKILEGLNVPRKGNEKPTSYTGANGRVYSLEIIQDHTSPNIAPRRVAIAKDFRGIVVLRGEPSFASDPQVLIDELKLRIDNQLP
mgnify:FL=1